MIGGSHLGHLGGHRAGAGPLSQANGQVVKRGRADACSANQWFAPDLRRSGDQGLPQAIEQLSCALEYSNMLLLMKSMT
jgi:hypothetical protein